MKILLLLAKAIEKQKLNSSRSGLFHIKTRVSLKYFVNDCIDITQNLTAAELLNSFTTSRVVNDPVE